MIGATSWLDMHEYTTQTTVLESHTLGQPWGQLSSQECQPLDHLEAGRHSSCLCLTSHYNSCTSHTLTLKTFASMHVPGAGMALCYACPSP